MPVGAQLREVGALVLLALAADQLGLRIVDVGPSELPARDREPERREVLALEEVVQVRGREAARLGLHASVAHYLERHAPKLRPDSPSSFAQRSPNLEAPRLRVHRAHLGLKHLHQRAVHAQGGGAEPSPETSTRSHLPRKTDVGESTIRRVSKGGGTQAEAIASHGPGVGRSRS